MNPTLPRYALGAVSSEGHLAELPTGTVLGGRFDVIGVLGRGGMATVYLAHDRVREARVALKVMHAHLAAQPSTRDRLRREVEASHRIRHPAALVANELHELDGPSGRLHAITMPFHSGRTLGERVATDGALEPEALRRLAGTLADVLATAHHQGVLHRDVTPANVMVDATDRPVLTDFGLARLADVGTRATGALGTAGYAAPELYRGVRTDPRSDVYSLGAVLYLAATGRPPFASESPMGTLERQLSGRLVPVRELAPGVPADLASTIERCLAVDPSDRPPGADALAEAVRSGVAWGSEPAAAPLPPPVAARPRFAGLPRGSWRVELRELRRQRDRRRLARVERGLQPGTGGEAFQLFLRQVGREVADAVGVRAILTPEDGLTRTVARVAGLPADALQTPVELWYPQVRLVEGVDRDTALHLANQARSAGFYATLADAERHVSPRPHSNRGKGAFLFLSFLPALFLSLVGLPVMMVAWVVLALVLGSAPRSTRAHSRAPVLRSTLPLAFPQDLTPLLTEAGRASLAAAEPVSSPQPPPPVSSRPSPGQALADRARTSLDGLDAALADGPAAVREDMARTSKELRAEVERLGPLIDRFGTEAARLDSAMAALDALEARAARLDTLRRAGTHSDGSEWARVEASLAAARADAARLADVERDLTAAQARLMEITAAAAAARRSLDGDGATAAGSADRLVERLRRDAATAARARREVQ